MFVLADGLFRQGWRGVDELWHWIGGFGLYVAFGVVAGALAGTLVVIERATTARLPRRVRALAPPLVYASAALAAGGSTVFWVFSGKGISETSVGRVGPYVVVTALTLGSAALFLLVRRVFVMGILARALVAAGLGLCAVAVIYVDQTLFVSLYGRLHALFEAVAALLFMLSIAICSKGLLGTRRRARSIARGASGALIGWTLVVATYKPARDFVETALRHTWSEEVYLGRMVRRAAALEAFASDPDGFQGLAMSRIEQLKKRYDMTGTAQSHVWTNPPPPNPRVDAKLRAMRPKPGFNVLFYYVDTLRHDVASDPALMPNTARFAEASLAFQRAYATGSDTLRSLPSLTGGRYDLGLVHDGDLLELARRAGYDDHIVIGKSAHEFLARLRPSFRFSKTSIVDDYDADAKVWGYGADRITAPEIVDRSLEWLEEREGNNPFFLWMFHFDVHSWRELKEDDVSAAAERYGIPEDEHPINWRYRVAARQVDAEFGRLLDGLARHRLEKDTIVVFLSDHGEALGRGGFWVHSVFLWDSLIHVPLLLRVPGLEPARIDSIVSLVDIAPTLGRYLQPDLDVGRYHGEDLLQYLLPNPPERRLPILLTSALKDVLERIGVVDPTTRTKLVVPLEAAKPELYDLNDSARDEHDLAEERPALVARLLSTLVRSPLFPRSPGDFDLLARDGRRYDKVNR